MRATISRLSDPVRTRSRTLQLPGLKTRDNQESRGRSGPDVKYRPRISNPSNVTSTTLFGYDITWDVASDQSHPQIGEPKLSSNIDAQISSHAVVSHSDSQTEKLVQAGTGFYSDSSTYPLNSKVNEQAEPRLACSQISVVPEQIPEEPQLSDLPLEDKVQISRESTTRRCSATLSRQKHGEEPLKIICPIPQPPCKASILTRQRSSALLRINEDLQVKRTRSVPFTQSSRGFHSPQDTADLANMEASTRKVNGYNTAAHVCRRDNLDGKDDRSPDLYCESLASHSVNALLY